MKFVFKPEPIKTTFGPNFAPKWFGRFEFRSVGWSCNGANFVFSTKYIVESCTLYKNLRPLWFEFRSVAPRHVPPVWCSRLGLGVRH